MRLAPRPSPPRGGLDPELFGAVLAAVFLATVHGFPTPSAWLPIPCLFKTLTTVPCPTCGMTRAWEALARADWGPAFRLSPPLTTAYAAAVAFLPYAMGALAGLWPRLAVQTSPASSRLARFLLLGAFLGTWIFLIMDGR